MPSWQTLHPAPSDRILKNPDAGYCFMAGLQPVSDFPDWLIDLSSMVYFRLAWADVVDAQGRPDFERLDREYFEGYRRKGLRLAFRIMAANPHSSKPYVTPKALLDKGIPTVQHRGVDGQMQVDPVFWDPLYLVEHEKMIRALGEYLDGKAWAGPVDLGGMGDWGEMHLSRWTALELGYSGWSPETYVRTVFALMDQMDRYLPRTTKAFCVAPILMPDPEPMFAQIVDRAARKGWWLRSDGCSEETGPPPYVWPAIKRWGGQVGLICEPSGGINRSYTGETVPVSRYLDAVLKAGPSVVNLMGLWDLKSLTASDRQVLRQAANKIGYRFRVEELVLPSVVESSPEGTAYLAGKIRLVNEGGSSYFGAALPVLSLRSAGVVVASQALMPQPPLSQIPPGGHQDIRFLIPLKAKGVLKLSLTLMDLQKGPLGLANAEQAADGSLALGSVALRAGGKTLGHVEWAPNPSQGIKVARTDEGWMLEGKNQGDWSFAGIGKNIPVKANCAYEMRVKIRAWPLNGLADPIHFKLGINDAKGAWITNIGSGKYDFSKTGIWQELTVSYTPQPGAAFLQPAMEKGRTAASSLKAELASWTLDEVPLP
ncbi:MAG: hypothetical protein V4498_02665 [candidate division FCPU426 bacterium]